MIFRSHFSFSATLRNIHVEFARQVLWFKVIPGNVFQEHAQELAVHDPEINY